MNFIHFDREQLQRKWHVKRSLGNGNKTQAKNELEKNGYRSVYSAPKLPQLLRTDQEQNNEREKKIANLRVCES